MRRSAALNILAGLSFLGLAGCASKQPTTADEGACVVTPPAEPVICTMEYVPVCGCDGKTYGNACTARGTGVPKSTPGACDDPGPR